MATYTLISSNVLTSSAASVTFSSIPATYTDLVLRASIRTDAAGTNYVLSRFNSDTAGNYSYTHLGGTGSAANSFSGINATFNYYYNTSTAADTSNTFSSLEIYVPSYLASQNKPSSGFQTSENNATAAYIGAEANLWRSTSAITTILLSPSASANFVSGSSFYLYGISSN
jgi:hypothetical protein